MTLPTRGFKRFVHRKFRNDLLRLALWGLSLSYSVAWANTTSDLHSAAITRIAVDPSEQILATVSEDKSLKIWELKTGRLIRTIHPPAGDGDIGKLYAVAISPFQANGRTIYLHFSYK